MKLCKACNGPVCPYCGGCINEGECSCETSEVMALKAKVEELEQLLDAERRTRRDALDHAEVRAKRESEEK